jgi:5-methylthioribose kinase
MFEITPLTAGEYLQASGRLEPGESLLVRELAGGVSNAVLLVELPARPERYVLKQARGRLRVAADWQCPVERIWREIDTLRICRQILSSEQSAARGSWQPRVPEILWEDCENFCYAMTAAPVDHHTWKECLLGGDLVDAVRIAAAAGTLLGQLHAGSWRQPAISAALADRTYFEALRVDPYYRQLVRNRPELAHYVEPLIDSLDGQRCALVHGDFSPKNLLVWPERLMLIDFEVGHFGDPAFDLGFFLTHLVLKEIWSGSQGEYLPLASKFWRSYLTHLADAANESEQTDLARRMVQHLAGCLLARIDGKSPVDYLPPTAVPHVRNLAIRLFAESPSGWDEAYLMIRQADASRRMPR